MYLGTNHDSDNIVSERGRFGVETACGTAAIDIDIGRLQNCEWYEACAFRTQSRAIGRPTCRIPTATVIA